MLLKTVIDDLVNNELGNLAIGKPQWSDARFNYNILIQCISMAYLELHKRFSLIKEEVLLRPMAGTTIYDLSYDHALSNSVSSEVKYIIDSAELPFSGSIVKIDQMFDSCNEPVLFNTGKPGQNIQLLKEKRLLIRDPLIVGDLTLFCRGLPAPISVSGPTELNTYELEIPPMYLEALYLYAAGRVHSNRGAENATNNESAIFMARFEQSCANIQAMSLNDTEYSHNDRLTQRGFV